MSARRFFLAGWYLVAACLWLAGPSSCSGGSSLEDNDGDGYLAPADCDDNNSAVNPGAREIPYNDVDEDCDGIALQDADLDGHDGQEAGGDDCDDGNAAIHPGAVELPYDGIDQDCDGLDDDADADGDGHGTVLMGGDDCCDSGLEVALGCSGLTAASMYPGAAEIPGDGIDQNCDGQDGGGAVVNDNDGDGFSSDAQPDGLDCDDNDAQVYPGAPERCNGIDDDCDGYTDETALDIDNDGVLVCFDCDDYDPNRSPLLPEIPYNDVDEDCDEVALMDVDGDTYLPGPDDDPSDDDCDDNDADIHPLAPERCNHLDDDCDGEIDEDFTQNHTDADLDGWLGGGDGNCPDCDDNDPAINPAAVEVVDGVDNDCDGLTDEVDLDGDGYLATPAAPEPAEPDCCDDGSEDVPGCSPATAAQIHPGAEEIASDGIDQDCDGADLVDADGDGHDSLASGGDDCDDYNPQAYPGHDEDCADPADNNCDGLRNENCGPGTGEEILIAAGDFNMGYDGAHFGDQKPEHLVHMSAFAIDKYEVTVAEYRRCVAHGPCTLNGVYAYSMTDENYWFNQARGLYPAIWINHYQAETYCQWVGKHLPSEAQWEMAARGAGDTDNRYPWGPVETTTNSEGIVVRQPVSCDLANHRRLWSEEMCVGDTTLVDAYSDGVSPFGLFNMAGNVAEWVADWYAPDYYQVSPSEDPPGPANGGLRVVRGGSFEDPDEAIEVVFRTAWNPAERNYAIGFRCARTLPAP